MRSVDSLVLIDTNQSASLPNLMWIFLSALFFFQTSLVRFARRDGLKTESINHYRAQGSSFFEHGVEIANNG
jgi:hypothetical protein